MAGIYDYLTTRDANAAVGPGNIRAESFDDQQLVNSIRQIMADLASFITSASFSGSISVTGNITLTGNVVAGGDVSAVNLNATTDVTSPLITTSGIKFPATATVPADPNTLYDYEKGTWTPAYIPTTGAFSSLTYSTQVGIYMKVAHQILLVARVTVNALTLGTAGGNLQLSGVPFVPTTIGQAVCIGYSGNWNATNLFGGSASSSVLFFYKRSAFNASNSTVQCSDLTSTADVMLSVSYYASV